MGIDGFFAQAEGMNRRFVSNVGRKSCAAVQGFQTNFDNGTAGKYTRAVDRCDVAYVQ
jgi:hypothetical protein